MDTDTDSGELPAFTPVPRRARKDGWTADKQRGFIAVLAETGNVRMAAERVGMTKEGAYQLRLGSGAESFRIAWEVAQEQGLVGLRDLAIERAQEGVVQPVFNSAGRQVGEKRVYNDRLLMFTLSHHSALSEIGKGRKSAQRQAQEEAVVAADQAARSEEEVAALLMEKFTTMELRLVEGMAEGYMPEVDAMSAAERMVLGLPPYPAMLTGEAAVEFHFRSLERPNDGSDIPWIGREPRAAEDGSSNEPAT